MKTTINKKDREALKKAVSKWIINEMLISKIILDNKLCDIIYNIKKRV